MKEKSLKSSNSRKDLITFPNIVTVVAEEPWGKVCGAGAGGGPRQGPGLRRRGRLHGVHPAVSTSYSSEVLNTGGHIHSN